MKELTAAHKTADERLEDLSGRVKVLQHIKPTNLDIERAAFLESPRRSPNFQYPEPNYDVDQVGTEIEAIEIPDDDLGEILKGVRRKLVLENDMIANLGDEDRFRNHSLELFGRPDEELVQNAHEYLNNLEKEKYTDKPNHNANEVVAYIQQRLNALGMEDWEARTSDRVLVATTNSSGFIELPSNSKYRDEAFERLASHEISHAMRAANGRLQKLRVLSHGLMGYWATEEGLALYCQRESGNLRSRDLLTYSARVIAVDSVYQGDTFVQTFEKLMSYKKFTSRECFNYALRAHRAGGYLKDHIYLQGIQKIEDFVDDEGDLADLYVGKISIAQLSIIKRLQEQGAIVPAKHLPEFLHSS